MTPLFRKDGHICIFAEGKMETRVEDSHICRGKKYSAKNIERKEEQEREVLKNRTILNNL